MENAVKSLEQEKESYVIQFEETRNKIGKTFVHVLRWFLLVLNIGD